MDGMITLRVITRVFSWIAAVGIAAMVALVVVSVMARYLAGSPLRYTEEMVGLLFCLCAFLPIGLTLLDGSAISVGPRDDAEGAPTATFVRRLIRHFATAAFLAILTKLLLDYSWQSFTFGSRVPASQLLVYPWAFAATAVTAFTALIELVAFLRTLIAGPSSTATGSART
jgi:TRAP-type C4-dicarboxylate transport system permease small subunit